MFVNCSFFLRLLTDDAEFKMKSVSKDEKKKEQREKKVKQEEQRAVAEQPKAVRLHSIKLSLQPKTTLPPPIQQVPWLLLASKARRLPTLPQDPL